MPKTRDLGTNAAADRDDLRGAAAVARETKFEHFTREQAPEVYRLMDDLIRTHHASDLAEAKIALMWVYDVKPDQDDHLTLGKARKIGAREQQFHDHHFVVELNWEAWNKILTPPQRRALLDHELEHCGRIESEDGESRYYIRKHDIEEFRSIVRRHGIYKQDLQEFVDAALQKDEPTLFDANLPAQRAVAKLRSTLGPDDTLEIRVPGRETVTLSGKGARKPAAADDGAIPADVRA